MITAKIRYFKMIETPDGLEESMIYDEKIYSSFEEAIKEMERLFVLVDYEIDEENQEITFEIFL